MSIIDIDVFMSFARIETGSSDATFAQTALTAAETLVRSETGRNFDTATSGTRVFAPRHATLLRINDCNAITSVTENGSALSASVMQYEPLNQLTVAGEYRPYDSIRRLSGWWYRDGQKATISIEATWGWLTIPEAVKEFVLVAGKDLYLAGRDAGVVDYSWVIEKRASMLESLKTRYRHGATLVA